MKTNTCIIKSVKNIEKYLLYLLDESRHKNQDIIDNDVLEKYEKQHHVSKTWKHSQESKKGHVPKPLSVVLSFPIGTTKDEFISLALEKIHLWIKKLSAMENLGLDDDAIEVLVKSIPYVAHYKESNPHVHFLLPKVLPNLNENTYTYVNIYKLKYTDPLYKLSGWSTKQKVIHKQQEKKRVVKSSELYLKDKLYNEIENYRCLNDKLDKYIALIEKDLERGHTQKAQKKLEKVRSRNVSI